MNEKQTQPNTLTQTVGEEPNHGETETILQQDTEKEKGQADKQVTTERIKTMNDVFRQTFVGGRVMFTQGIQHMPEADMEAIISQVRQFNDFTGDNDPHGEHDFGIIKHNRESVYWKIDYYDEAMRDGSEDPSDPKQTTRVLTIMLASEY